MSLYSTQYPIADLHCDLLSALLHDPKRTPYDDIARCSVAQMKAGGVKLQVLPVYTDSSKGSSVRGVKQGEIFKNLLFKYNDVYEIFNSSVWQGGSCSPDKIQIMCAIENASAFCAEEESFEDGLLNLEKIEKAAGKILYVSLTHSHENRFGGPSLLFKKGKNMGIGLKEDGRRILEILNEKNIAIDLSHASDRLAFDILDHVEKKKFKTSVIISHAAFRSICDIQRNMPDEILKEVILKGGIIGLNMLRPFLGPDDEYNIVRQVEHILKIGGEKNFGFGCDFFCDTDYGGKYRPEDLKSFFFPDFDNSSMYPRMLELLKKELKLSDNLLQDITHRNVLNFIEKWQTKQYVA